MFLPSWKGGRPAALDVTVISTMQQATIQGAASTQGHTLVVGEARKLAAHGDACQAVGVFLSHWVWRHLGDECFSSRHTGLHRRLLGQRLGIPLLTLLTTSSRSVPFPSGGETLPFGHVASLPCSIYGWGNLTL